ncbi:hypothetical protein CIL03_08425 [Virgibacillus indicus]|uniref:Conjugal transfer protein n=1 Tax=Virgibacillus indicus TaxID=2024554 RepID=A0A265NAK8_9BACI|nr:TcpE family conjugal transfer membrane protein [Virgibacillus indicus]OZU89033.1 hypothetical protein CIL03_08425 [Virgibacillus indicus]
MEEQNRKIPLYFINNFLKFDRKLYQIFGMKLGRPVPLKGVLYAMVIGLAEVIWYFTPVLGRFISWIPVGILIALPITLAWLLTDIGTENRSPVAFFRSLFQYHLRKFNRVTYVRGKEIEKETTFQFYSHFTLGIKEDNFRRKKHVYKGYVTYR